MSHQNKNNPMDEQEKAAELAAQTEVKEEEVREKIITEFGFDAVDDAEKIDKLVLKEVENSKKLSAAIGQKIKYRTEAEDLRKNPKVETKVVPPADIDKVVAEQFEKRDLDSLEYSDDLKKEIQRVAQIQGVSIKQAARDPYIVNKIADYEKQQKVEEATISRTNRSGGKKSYTFDNPPEVDMATPEGRKEWDEYTKAMKQSGF